jgi:hypothetical protein
MTGHQTGSGDPADEALAQRLSWNLLDAVRGVGLGRGLDLALRTLFIRWVALTDPEHGPTPPGAVNQNGPAQSLILG